jgi:hypothetical protein
MSNNNNGKNSGFSNIIIGIIVVFCLFKISECRKHEIARDIMKDKEFRKAYDIRKYEDAEKAAEEIMDAQSEGRGR